MLHLYMVKKERKKVNVRDHQGGKKMRGKKKKNENYNQGSRITNKQEYSWQILKINLEIQSFRYFLFLSLNIYIIQKKNL